MSGRLLTLLFALSGCWSAVVDKEEAKCLDQDVIVNKLMDNYNKHNSPTFHQSVLVRVRIGLQEVSAISDSTADFRVTIFIYEEWLDGRLAYDHLSPCERNITLIEDRLELLWTPNTCFINNKYSVLLHTPFLNAKIIIMPNGLVLTSYRMTLVGPCDMDLTTFPMDSVRCSLTFESFNYNVEEVHMQWHSEQPIFLEDDQRIQHYYNVGNPLPSYLHMEPVKISDFSLVHMNTSAVAYDYPAGYWDELTVTFTFRRRMGWYILQAYFPTYLVIFISWISFYLGTGMAARAMLGVNTLLALTFQFGNIIKNLPRVSYVKAIDVWMLSCMTFIFCNLLELTIIGYITSQNQLGNANRTPLHPESVKAILLRRLAKTSPDRIDKIASIVFPICFFLFNLIYWLFYTNY